MTSRSGSLWHVYLDLTWICPVNGSIDNMNKNKVAASLGAGIAWIYTMVLLHSKCRRIDVNLTSARHESLIHVDPMVFSICAVERTLCD